MSKREDTEAAGDTIVIATNEPLTRGEESVLQGLRELRDDPGRLEDLAQFEAGEISGVKYRERTRERLLEKRRR